MIIEHRYAQVFVVFTYEISYLGKKGLFDKI